MLPAPAAEAFPGSALIAPAPTVRKLQAIYFDTPDHLLHKAGVSLRIRRSGRQRIQTVKGAGSRAAGLFTRPEWERPVPGDAPLLGDDTPLPALLGQNAAALAPAFTVKVERTLWLLDEGEATIEMVLDRGTVIAAERTAPVCEIELELQKGEPHALFALARRLAAALPLRLGVLSKAERGYALLGPLHAAFKAETVQLDPAATASEACRAILALCIRHYRLNEELLLAGREPEALHQARVALRRLRSAMAIFKPVLAPAALAHLHAELRWLGGVLGDARDLDVLLEKAEPGKLRDHLHSTADKAHATVRAALESRRCLSLRLDLAEWAAVGAWRTPPARPDLRDAPARDYAAHALQKLRKRMKKRGAGLETLSDEERHALRKSAKRLRYGVDFFAGLFPKHKGRKRKFAASLAALQDNLGDLNDLATAPRLLERLALADQPDARDLPHHRDKARILTQAQKDFDTLIGRKTFWS